MDAPIWLIAQLGRLQAPENVARRGNFEKRLPIRLTDGGFRPDGSFRPLVWFDPQQVERLFRAEVLRILLSRNLITEQVVTNLLSWRHSGFSAHGAVCVQDREGAVRLGRYMIRCPIVLERLAWDEGAGQVVCRSRPTRRSRPLPAEARWDVLEFLARVIDHIPEPSQQTVRYWGYYSNAARGKRHKAAEAGVRSQTSRRQDDDEFTRSSRPKSPNLWLTRLRERSSSLHSPLESAVPRPAARPRGGCVCWGLHLVDD